MTDDRSDFKWIKNSSGRYDWVVTYEEENGHNEDMTVFGQDTEEEARKEAIFSLSGAGHPFTGKIISVTRIS